MSNVRVYMRAGWTKSFEGTSDVTVREYEDAHIEARGSVEGRELRVLRGKEEIALFPRGDWAGVELY